MAWPNNVLTFSRPERQESPSEYAEHLNGKARCMACRHEWQAVAPVGVNWMECPACGTMKGRYMHPAVPYRDEKVWECACGCIDFIILASPPRAFCVGCATEQRF